MFIPDTEGCLRLINYFFSISLTQSTLKTDRQHLGAYRLRLNPSVVKVEGGETLATVNEQLGVDVVLDASLPCHIVPRAFMVKMGENRRSRL